MKKNNVTKRPIGGAGIYSIICVEERNEDGSLIRPAQYEVYASGGAASLHTADSKEAAEAFIDKHQKEASETHLDEYQEPDGPR